MSLKQMDEQRKAIEAFIARLADKVVAQWWEMSCYDPATALYLYTKQGDAVAADEADGYDLAMNERLSTAWDKAQCRRKVMEALRRMPILPAELCRPLQGRIEASAGSRCSGVGRG